MERPIIDYIVVFAVPVGTIIAGIAIGWLFKRFIHHRLKKLTEKTEWKGDDVVFDAIESHIVLWFFLASLNTIDIIWASLNRRHLGRFSHR